MTGERLPLTCADHVYGPENYAHWHEWAERMAKTHRQIRCPECGLYAIWLPKEQTR